MDDDADVHVDADRPKVRVFDAIELMKPQARTGWIQLQVKSSGLDGFLFLAGQLGEAVGEGVRDSKFHLCQGLTASLSCFLAELKTFLPHIFE